MPRRARFGRSPRRPDCREPSSGVLPVGFFAFLWITSRNEIEGAFRSPAGIGAIALGLMLEGLAFVWIRHLLEVR